LRSIGVVDSLGSEFASVATQRLIEEISMRERLRKWWRPVATLTALAAMGSAALLTADSTPADAASSVTVNAGGGEAGVAVELFRPATVRLGVGDTLNVINDYEEPHTLSFILDPADIPAGIAGLTEPFGSSEGFNGSSSFSTGLLEKDDTTSVTFSTKGSYRFLCLIHPGMTLDVTVGNAGEPTVVSPGAQAFLQAGIDLGEQAADAVSVPAAAAADDGSKTWTVPTGPSVPYQGSTVDVMRFMAPQLEIGVGDTVTWSNDTGVPHTITFLPGPPPDDFNPFSTTKPSDDFDSAELYNGIISIAPEFGGIETFSLTFTEPGTYTYICVLHIDQGMAGVITVGDGFNTISPPNTGDGGLPRRPSGHSTGYWMIYSGLVLLAASLVAGGIVARNRR
jgi:plastocyanin